MVNGVPREVPSAKAEGPQAPRVSAAGLARGTPFTTLHPRLFHILSFFGHPGLVKRDFFPCCKTQLSLGSIIHNVTYLKYKHW